MTDNVGIYFTVPGEAVGKGRPRAFRRGGFIRMHTPEKTANYEHAVRVNAAAAMGEDAPMTGPLAAVISVTTVPPPSWSKKRRALALAGVERPTVKPDLDNVAKAILDAVNGVAFEDDKQVVELVVRKTYDAEAGAAVHIYPIEAAA